MNTSMRTRLIATALVAGVVIPVAPATAKPINSGLPGTPVSAEQNDSGTIVLRRDGSEATPFVPNIGQATEADEIVLRRDGSEATPFVADTGAAPDEVITARGPVPTLASSPSPSGDGFDWGDAAIGAGVLTAMLLAGLSTGHRRRQAAAPAGAVSQGV